MFTGIITSIGEVKDIKVNKISRDFTITTNFDMKKVPIGASISCSGVCLTVASKGRDWFKANASKETLDRTTAGFWKKGKKLNLEGSLKMGDELGGHIVFGHVDGIAEVVSKQKVGDSYKLSVFFPPKYKKFIVEKGSVSLDGVSLTVNALKGNVLEINLVPHTWQNTTFSSVRVGDMLNLEIDMLARYVAKNLEAI